MLRRILTLVLVIAALPSLAAPPAAAQPSDDGTTYTWPKRFKDGAIGDSLFVERTQGASATLRFTGTRATWYTFKGPMQGRARVLLDGDLVGRVNNYAPRAELKAARRVTAASHGEHVLRIVVAGEQGAPDGGGRWIAVDAFRVDGRFVPASEGRYHWDLVRTGQSTYRRSSAAGARAAFAFSGKGIDWATLTGPDGGRARVWIDGIVRETVDTYSTDTGSLLYDVAGLVDTQHAIIVEVLGTKRAASGGTDVAVDGWIVRRPSARAFRSLGTWVDLWDYDADPNTGQITPDPVTVTTTMAERGVQTLYLQTARYTSDSAFEEKAAVGPWVEAAHAAGLQIVGWYLPGYDEHLGADVRRTAAIAAFRSSAGEGFDALAVDIEHVPGGPSGDTFNSGIRTHLRRVRNRVGNQFPIGVIIPAPVAMDHLNASYAGFPYASIGRYGDAVLPMGYWSYRSDSQCAEDAVYCALGYTQENTARAGARTGLPVHVIGGIANEVSGAEVDDFVTGARAADAFGGSLYDYNTMSSGFWARLAPLNG